MYTPLAGESRERAGESLTVFFTLAFCLPCSACTAEDFNISTPVGHTVKELAEVIWRSLQPHALHPIRLAMGEYPQSGGAVASV